MSGNSGSYFNSRNLIPALMTGNLSYGITSLIKNLKPEKPPNLPPPPGITPPPSANDQNPEVTAQQRAKKLAALQFGFASTVSKDSTFGNAQTATPGLKAKLGN